MTNKTGPTPSKDFAAAAGRPQAAALLLAEMERIARNIDMADAALGKDWARVEKLAAAGADPTYRDMTALRAFAEDGDLAAALLAQKLATGPLAFMASLPLLTAAEEGRQATVDHILAQNPPDHIVSAALSAALRNDRAAIADQLYARLKGKDLDDEVLADMLIRRPEMYAEATKARKEPPDYIVHFMKACEAKDASAIYRALDAMQEHRATLRPNIERHKEEFEIGMGHQEALMTLVQSGQVPAMARYFENFTDLCPTNLEMFMVIALAVSPTDVNPLQPIVDKFKPDEKTADFAFTYAAQMRNIPALKYLAETFPALAQKNSKDLLGALAAQKTPEAFFGALKSGYAVPRKAVEKAELLAESLMSGNKDVTAHLESTVLFTPAAVVRMQAYHDLRVLRRAAEAIGDWHFRDDLIFWRALGQGDRETLAAFPQDKKISIADRFNVDEGLTLAIAHGDFDLLKMALDRAAWDAPAREHVFMRCLAAPEALAAFDLAAFPVRPLTEHDLKALAAGTKAPETLALLEAKGFTAPPVDALKAAIENSNAPLAEYLLAKGADIIALAPALMETLDRHASREMTDVVGKWAARSRDIPAPDLAARLAAAKAEDLFQGPESLAITAAYAGKFPALMRRAGAFDPALLASTKDAQGNSVLEILGAHGRVNDVLTTELWMERDPAAFLQQNLPPRYLPQCDLKGLTAAINQLRLKNRVNDKRLKGP